MGTPNTAQPDPQDRRRLADQSPAVYGTAHGQIRLIYTPTPAGASAPQLHEILSGAPHIAAGDDPELLRVRLHHQEQHTGGHPAALPGLAPDLSG